MRGKKSRGKVLFSGRLILVGLALLWAWVLPAVALTPPQHGTFLVASENIADPRFRQAVVLLIQHDVGGTIGLIVNKPLLKSAALRLPGELGKELAEAPLFYGGPLSPHRIGVLFRSHTQVAGATEVLPGLFLTSVLHYLQLPSTDVLHDGMRVVSGYSGWAPGQLNRELARGDWKLVPARPADLLISPESLWQRLLGQDGLLVGNF